MRSIHYFKVFIGKRVLRFCTFWFPPIGIIFIQIMLIPVGMNLNGNTSNYQSVGRNLQERQILTFSGSRRSVQQYPQRLPYLYSNSNESSTTTSSKLLITVQYCTVCLDRLDGVWMKRCTEKILVPNCQSDTRGGTTFDSITASSAILLNNT